METKLGQSVAKNTKAVLYLCEYDITVNTIKVIDERQYEDAFEALNAYSNIPNPESHLVSGNTHEELCTELQILHDNLEDQKWLTELGEML